ncbi:MAG: hypothetical protein EOO00_09295, partial [Chitinophagaceae bacterium]
MQQDQLYDRYQRQIILPGFGEPAQEKLSKAKVLVIGAGGLGCPVLQYLVAAGVGSIGIADDDKVSLSNLHRQVLYNVQLIGEWKTKAAASVLQQLNPFVRFETYPERVANLNVVDIIAPYDLVIDCTDNFSTRYLVNDACVLLDKPLVYGAVSQFEGQVAVFNMKIHGSDSTNYRDLFPQAPAPGEIQNCEEAGVLGVVPGIIGTMMAGEAIKIITGIGEPLINQLLTYNIRNNQLYVIKLKKGASTQNLPQSIAELKKTDYDIACGISSNAREISVGELVELCNDPGVTIIDVRNMNELPAINELKHLRIPLADLSERTALLKTNHLVLICQSGKRSVQGAHILAGIFGNNKIISSVRGGVLAWKQTLNQ